MCYGQRAFRHGGICLKIMPLNHVTARFLCGWSFPGACQTIKHGLTTCILSQRLHGTGQAVPLRQNLAAGAREMKSMSIDRERLDSAIADFKDFGVNDAAENNIVVSLTSFSERMGTLHYALFSLLRQTLKPWKVILWLAHDEFPGREQDLPPAVAALCKNGLEIRWYSNLRQYSKLVPALRAYPDKIIAVADDDAFYRRDWLELLYKDYLENNRAKMLYAHRAHRIMFGDNGFPLRYEQWEKSDRNKAGARYCNFPTGVGGVLYPPGALHEDATNEDIFMRLAPHADDIFYWGMAVLNDTKIRVINNNQPIVVDINPENNDFSSAAHTLYKINTLQGKNDEQFASLLEAYPEIYLKISIENRLLDKTENLGR